MRRRVPCGVIGCCFDHIWAVITPIVFAEWLVWLGSRRRWLGLGAPGSGGVVGLPGGLSLAGGFP